MPYIYPTSIPSLLSQMAQPMLLAKPLTTFLSQNTSTSLPTLILLSPSGKLLASSSPLPASTLRTQATLASSLWTLYHPSTSSLITSTITATTTQRHTSPRSSDATLSSTTTAAENELATVTIQLSHGIMVIRALSCGLLFVAIGSSPASISSPEHTLHASAHTSPPSSPPSHHHVEGGYEGLGGGHYGERERDGPNLSLMGLNLGSGAPSEAGSVGSAGTSRAGSIMVIKRQAEEVGKWLDVQLEGFVLSSTGGR